MQPVVGPLSRPSSVPCEGAGKLGSMSKLPFPAARPEKAPGGAGAEAPDQYTFYYQVGGRPVFEQLCREFYRRVAADPEFSAMYPEEDLGPAERRLFMFLEQYWGGPKDYQVERGHPRLRMRHNPFPIGAKERDTWLRYMRQAMDTLELSPLHDAQMWDYFERAAHAMQNRP